MVVLATLATIIASQAALTGSFSVAKQAVQLGFLPAAADRPHLQPRGPDLRAAHQLVLVRGRGGARARLPELQSPGRHLRRRGDRDLHPQHDPVPGRRAGAVADAEVAARHPRHAVPHRRGGVLHLQPGQDRRRRLPVAGRGPGHRGRDDDLAPGPRHRHQEPHPGRGPARRVPGGPVRGQAADHPAARHRHLPQPRQARRPRSRCARSSSTTTPSTRGSSSSRSRR